MGVVRPIYDRIYGPDVVWVILVTLFCFSLAALFNRFAGIGAGIAGGLLWWALIERPAMPTLFRGGLFGFLTALLAYPLTWIIGAAFGHPLFRSAVTGSVTGSLDSLSELTGVMTAVLFGSALSLVITLFTIPVAVGAGLGLVILRRKFRFNDVGQIQGE